MLPLQVLWIWNHWLESRSRVDPVWIFFIVVYWFSLDFLCDACLLVEKQFTRGPSLEFVHDDWSGVEVGHRCGTWSPVTARRMSRKTSNSVSFQVFFSWPPRLFPRFCWRCDLSRCAAWLSRPAADICVGGSVSLCFLLCCALLSLASSLWVRSWAFGSGLLVVGRAVVQCSHLSSGGAGVPPRPAGRPASRQRGH